MAPRWLRTSLGTLKISWPLIAAVLILLGLAYESMSIISSTRAYVNGESLWSKGHKDAVFHLIQYSRTRDPKHFALFQEAIKVPLGDRIARLNLDGPNPDPAIAKAGFLQGGVHPDDVDGIVVMFQRFRHVSFFAAAVNAWSKGDEYIDQLRALGEEMNALIQAGEVDPEKQAVLDERLRVINRELTPLTSEFSVVLGEAARTTRAILWVVMVLAAMILLPLGLVLINGILKRTDAMKRQQEILEQEVAIASKIQVSILPRTFTIAGLEIAAGMKPADDVGGDCFDVHPTQDGCWLAIGDVAGHGLISGLIALMTQSTLQGITLIDPGVQPIDALCALNEALFENIRNRMKQDEHVTFVLLRCYHDGRVVFAGAHEELIVYRAQTKTFERIATRGAWLGAMKDIRPHTYQGEFRLEDDDVLVLYSDGIIESSNLRREEFGFEGIERAVTEHVAEGPQSMVTSMISESLKWGSQQRDDLSALVVRRVAIEAPEKQGASAAA